MSGIRKILEDINDIDKLMDNLDRLPVEQSSLDQINKLLAIFIKRTSEAGNVVGTKMIIDFFDVKRIAIDPLPMITLLFSNKYMTDEHKKFVAECYPQKAPCDYFVDLINCVNRDNLTIEIANTLTKLLTYSGQDWNILYKLTEDPEESDDVYENILLKNFIKDKLDSCEEKYIIPYWVREYSFIPPTPTPKEVLAVDKAVEKLLHDLKSNGLTVKKSQLQTLTDTLISQYGIATTNEKLQMTNITTIEYDDTGNFREYGPVNTQYFISSDYKENILSHKCEKFGGCRMFLCSEFEDTYSNGNSVDIMTDDTIELDWFRGSCDLCESHIPKRHYAIRLPLPHGGWKGCYCNIECLSNSIPNPTDQLTKTMISRLEEQLDAIGIRDR